MSHSQITVNGEIIKKHPDHEIKLGDKIEIIKLEKIVKTDQKPTRNRPIAIYFEDDYYLAALKPAGILSCGDKTGRVNNSYHKVLESFLSERNNYKTKLWVIHRIDREVEGLMIFAKSEEAQIRLIEQWQTVLKKYIAVVENKPKAESGFIENWLRDSAKQMVSEFTWEIEGSKFAKTQYQVLRSEGKYQVLEVTLHTGRKNQIRVHLSGIGCPIVGDRKYGADASVERQIRLAAYYVNFNHPYTNNPVEIKYYPTAKFFKPSQMHDENYHVM